MNKEQIQQKFKDLIEDKIGTLPSEEGELFLGPSWINVNRIIELLEIGFNFGLEVAADNAEADVTILTEDGQYEIDSIQLGYDYEVYVLKNSILKFKL